MNIFKIFFEKIFRQNMITIETAKTEQQKNAFAELALKEGLHLSIGALKPIMEYYINDENKSPEISLAWRNNDLAGVSMYFPEEYYGHYWRITPDAVVCFVKDEHRRKGIGTLLVNSFEKDTNKLFAYEGITGSHTFWSSLNITDAKTLVGQEARW